MLGAVATMMVAAGLLAAWKGLPVLLIGRLLTGVAAGLAAGTAITYLIELRLRADPKASMVRARTIGTSISVGALGVGPLIAGCLAQWARWPLTLPYLVVLALGAVASGRPVVRARDRDADTATRRRTSRPVTLARLPVPAAAGTMAAFAASGLFAGLAGLILAITLGRTLARTGRRHAVPGVLLRRGLPAGHDQAARPRVCSPLARSPCSPASYSS